MKFKNAIAQDCYNTMASDYSKMDATQIYKSHYNYPAIHTLLPEIKGSKVLDVGCGTGILAQELLQKGANVTGMDVSENMLKIAAETLGPKVKLFQADLAEPIDFLEDESFDIVVASLSIHYIKHWDPVFEEFYRVLRPEGELVFSTVHPFDNFDKSPSGVYFETELIEDVCYRCGHAYQLRYYRRSFTEILAPVLSAGFIINKVLEPLPIPEAEQLNPEYYQDICKKPKLLLVRSNKRG